MNYLIKQAHPRIGTIDCRGDVVDELLRRGYDVSDGSSGYFAQRPEMAPPARLHEKDLLLIDLDPGWTVRNDSALFTRNPYDIITQLTHLRDVRLGRSNNLPAGSLLGDFS